MQVRATFVTKYDQVRRGAIGYRIGYTEDYGMVHTATVTLSDFLLARIGEDEEAGNGFHDFDRPHWRFCNYFGPEHMGGGVCDCNYAARVLAECEAKRRVIADVPYYSSACVRVILGHLALPYADHPDYRDEWKP